MICSVWNHGAAGMSHSRLVFLAVAVGRILLEAARGRLAVVHLNLAERGSVYRKAVLMGATKLAGGRVLLHLHAAQLVQSHATTGRSGKAVLRWMFRSADHCVVLGDVWRRWVIDTFGVRPNRVGVIYNGVPATMSKPRATARDGRFPPAVRRQSAGAKGCEGFAPRLRQPDNHGARYRT